MPTLDDIFGNTEDEEKKKRKTMTLDEAFAEPAVPAPEPGFLQRMIQPGGIASPENVGITGGGMIGAALGTPLGPPGMLAGGLIGAGLGGIFGRGSEQVLGPEAQQPETLRDALSQLGEASQRGMVSQAAGDIGGALISKALAPFAKRMTPARQAVQQEAEQLGIPMTAGQITGSGLLGQAENLIPRTPVSVGQSEKFLGKQQEGIVNALRTYADDLAPGAPRGLSEVGRQMAPALENAAARPETYLRTQQGYAKQALEEFVDKIAPGAAKDMQEAGQMVEGSVRARFTNAKEAAGRLYKAAYAVTKGEEFPLDDYAAAVQRVLGEETPQGQFATGVGRQGQSVLGANTPATSAPGGAILDVLQSTPSNMTDVETMHTVRSRLLGIIRESAKRSGYGSDPDGRAAAMLLNGMDASLSKVKGQYPTLGPLLDAADVYYRDEVAQVFKAPQVMKTLAARVREKKYDQVVPLVFGPGKSVGPLEALKKASGPEAFDGAAASWMQGLLNQASAGGEFSPEKFFGQFTPRAYSPAYLEAALKPEGAAALQRLSGTFAGVSDVAQDLAAPASVQALAKLVEAGKFDKLVPGMFAAGSSRGALQAVQGEVGPAVSDQAAAAWLHDLVTRATDAQTGQFSLQRYLSSMSERNYSQGFMADALREPPRVEALGRIIGILQQVQGGRLSGANSSQTARALIGWAQLGTAVSLAGKMAYNQEVTGEDVGAAAGLMAPNLLGRWLLSERGIALLTRTQAPQLPQNLARIAAKLATLAVYPSTAEQQDTLRQKLEEEY